MQAIRREQKDFAMQSMSIAYSPASHAAALAQGNLNDPTWDDTETTSRSVGPKTKKEKHSELVASVLAELLSPAFKDKVTQLHGTEMHTYLADLLQRASLCTDDPSGKQELLHYLKQVVLTVHGVDLSDSAISAAAQSDPRPDHSNAEGAAVSDAATAAAHSQLQGAAHSRPSSSHSEPADDRALSTEVVGAHASLPSTPAHAASLTTIAASTGHLTPRSDVHPADDVAGGMAGVQAAANAGAAAAQQQLALMPALQQGTGHSVGVAGHSQLAALISAAASAATTAAAAAVAGVWSQQGSGWGAWPAPGLAGYGTLNTEDRQPDTGQWRDQQQHVSIAHKGEEGSPEPLPHKLDPRIAAVGRGQQQQTVAGTVPRSPWASERQFMGHPSTSTVRVVKLGQPRITARAAPAPGGDSPVLQGFQDFRPGQQQGGSTAHGASAPLPLPQVDFVPLPATHSAPPVATARFDVPPGPSLHTTYHFPSGTNEQVIHGLQQPAYDGINVSPAQRGMSPPRPAFKPPGKLAASPRRAVSEPDVIAVGASDQLPGHHSPVAAARQQQARQAATHARWDPAQGTLYAATGVQPSTAPGNAIAYQHSQHPLNQPQPQPQQLLVDVYGPKSQTSMSPTEHLKALAEIQTGMPVYDLKPAGAGNTSRTAGPAQHATVQRRRAPLPQELQQTVHRTLAYLSDPVAAAPPTAWPPDNRLMQVNERQVVERELAAQLGGPLDYGKLVQELEQARHQSLLLRPTQRGMSTHMPPAHNTTSPSAGLTDAVTITQPLQHVAEAVPPVTVEPLAGLQSLQQDQQDQVAGGGGRKATLTSLVRLQARQRQKQRAGATPTTAPVHPTSKLASNGAEQGAEGAATSTNKASPGTGNAVSASQAVTNAAQSAGVWPPVSSVWEDDAAWTDMNAYAKALQQEVHFRAAQPVSAAPAAADVTTHASGPGVRPMPARRGMLSYQQPTRPDQASDSAHGDARVARRQLSSGPEAHRDTDKAISPQQRAATAIAAAEAARTAAPATKPKPKVQLAFGQRVPITGAGAGAGKAGPARTAAARAAASQQQQQDNLVQAVVAAVTAALANHSLPGQTQGLAAQLQPVLEAHSRAAAAGKLATPMHLARGMAAAAGLSDSSPDSSDTVSRVLSALASVLADEEQDMRSSVGDAAEAIHDPVSDTPDMHGPQGRTPPPAGAAQRDAGGTPIPSARRALLRVLHMLQQSTRSPLPMQQQAREDAAAPAAGLPVARPRPQFMHVQDTTAPPEAVATFALGPANATPSQPQEHYQSDVPTRQGLTWGQQQQPPVQPSVQRSHAAALPGPSEQQQLQPTQLVFDASRSSMQQQMNHHQQQQQQQECDGEQQEELPATLPRMWLYGDGSKLMSAGQQPHPGQTTYLQEAPVPNSLKDALMDLLVEDVMGKVILKQAASAATSSSAAQLQHVSSLEVTQPPSVPLITDVRVAYQLVREVLQEQLTQMLAPISQDQVQNLPSQAGSSAVTTQLGAAAASSTLQAQTTTQATCLPRTVPPATIVQHTQPEQLADSAAVTAPATVSILQQQHDNFMSATGMTPADDAAVIGTPADNAERMAAVQAGQEAAAAALAAITSAEQAITAGSTSSGSNTSSFSAQRAVVAAYPSSKHLDTPLVSIISTRSESQAQLANMGQGTQSNREDSAHMPASVVSAGPSTLMTSTSTAGGLQPAELPVGSASTGPQVHTVQAQPQHGLQPLSQTVTIQVPVPIPVPYPYPTAPAMLTATSKAAASMPGSTTFTASPHFLARSATRQQGPVSSQLPGTRAAGVRPHFNLPGLEQLLLDSTDLDSSAESQAINSALQRAMRGQAASTARALGRPSPADTTAQGLEQAVTRSYPDASLEVLLAPRPSIPTAVASSSGPHPMTADDDGSRGPAAEASAQVQQGAAASAEQSKITADQPYQPAEETAVFESHQQATTSVSGSSHADSGLHSQEDGRSDFDQGDRDGQQVQHAPHAEASLASSSSAASSTSSSTTTAAAAHSSAYSEDSTWQHAAVLPSGHNDGTEDGGLGEGTGMDVEHARSVSEVHSAAVGGVAVLDAGDEPATTEKLVSASESNTEAGGQDDLTSEGKQSQQDDLASEGKQSQQGSATDAQHGQQEGSRTQSQQTAEPLLPAGVPGSTEQQHDGTTAAHAYNLPRAPSLPRPVSGHTLSPRPSASSSVGGAGEMLPRSPSLPRPPSGWRLQQQHSQELRHTHSGGEEQQPAQAKDDALQPQAEGVQGGVQGQDVSAPGRQEEAIAVQHASHDNGSSVAQHVLSDHVETQHRDVSGQQQQSPAGMTSPSAGLVSRLAEGGLHAWQQPEGAAVRPNAATIVLTPAQAGLPALTVAESPARLPNLADYTGPVHRLWRAPISQQTNAYNTLSTAFAHDTLLASDEAGSSSTSSHIVAAQHVTITSRSSDDEAGPSAGAGRTSRRAHATTEAARRVLAARRVGSRQGVGSSARMRHLSERRQRLLQELGIDDELLHSQATTATSTSVSNDLLQARPSY